MSCQTKEKIKPVNFTFEQIEGCLYSAAYKIVNNLPNMFSNMYELDELVNTVWLKGNVQRLDHIQLVARKAYFDMIDYMRKTEGRDFMRNGVVSARPREFTNTHNWGVSSIDQSCKNDLFEERSIDNGNQYFNCVDNKEEVEYALSRIPIKYSNVLREYYLKGKTLKEIGKKIDKSESLISNWRTIALQMLQADRSLENGLRVTNAQKKKSSLDGRHKSHCFAKQKKEMVDVLPEYVSDFEIDNKCAFDDSLEKEVNSSYKVHINHQKK